LDTGSKVGFGMKRIDLAADQQSLLAVDLGPSHASALHPRVDVTDERVGGLVVVVVGVEGPGRALRMVGRAHGRTSSRRVEMASDAERVTVADTAVR
jgi:hypothetical protein